MKGSIGESHGLCGARVTSNRAVLHLCRRVLNNTMMQVGLLLLACAALRLGESYIFKGPMHMRKAQQAARSSRLHSEETYASQQEYLTAVKQRTVLPSGFSVGTARFTFSPKEVSDKTLPMNMTVILLDEPTPSYAAMFTSNQFPGAPVLVGRDLVSRGQALQAIVVNNKISNVCPGGLADGGRADCEAVCVGVEGTFGLEKGMVFPSSTGIIGWRLPVDTMLQNIPSIKSAMQSDSLYPAALSITTTDRYPKARSYVSKEGWSLSGIAKGAGMIEPHMATMLSYILTDLDLPKEKLEAMLRRAVKRSYNAISIDGDQSTSDTVLLISSQKVPCSSQAQAQEAEFESALSGVTLALAADMVRNGEGTQHVMRVSVTGTTDALALGIGRAVVNSNLVKCAVSGNDPNVGRIAGAVGSYLGNLGTEGMGLAEGLEIWLGGIQILANRSFKLDGETEVQLSDYMLEAQLFPASVPESDRNYPPHERYVEIEVRVGGARGEAFVVLGSDLTKEYVEVNADYRS